MSLRLANRRFAPSFVGTVLVVVGVATFLQLGAWQLRRAELKQTIQTAYETGSRNTVPLTAENIASLPRYQQVSARGRFAGERQILLDNMPSAQGQPGYRVLTPFALSFGGLILVDRGWIPMGDRSRLPELEVDDQARTVTGRLDLLPRPGLRLQSDPEILGTWPQVMNFPERHTIERALGSELAPSIVLLDAGEPDGFERAWQHTVRLGPERHIGYAVQWFAFALTAAVIYLIMSFKVERSTHDGPE